MKRALLLLLSSIPLVACGTDVSGPAPSLLSCAFGVPSTLSTGGVLHTSGSANTACIAPDERDAAEFVYIPFFAAAPPEGDATGPSLTLEIEVLGGGERPGESSASRREQSVRDPALETRFHRRLRQREIEELTPLIRRGPAGPPAAAVRAAPDRPTDLALSVPSVGDLRTYNVAISCSEEDLRTGRVVDVSEHAIVVADTANPAGLTPQDYAYFGITFDTLVYPVETAHFGVPQDIDDNGRSILFFTRAVNELSPRAGSVTIGFFWSGDLFPVEATDRLEACPASNHAEMFYLIAPDPRGVVGPELPLSKLRELAIPLIGHEFQHLVNASRRLFVNDADGFEQPWLNEGLSHIAEELLFYAVTGLERLRNLTADDVRAVPNGVDAFNEYVSGNLSNLGIYLSDPDDASLMGSADQATRGAAWAFLRYAADRTGRGDREFFFDLVNSRTDGLDNLAGVIGPHAPLDWMRDWTVSLYADDLVPGIDDRFTTRSWDLRSIYGGTTRGVYPLEVHALGGSGSVRASLSPGETHFSLFGVAADRQAILHVDGDGAELPAALQGSFLRVR